MKKKYNLALTPMSKGEEFINLSQQFSSIADKYLLSQYSLPHVTLYQFESEEKEIENVWGKIINEWQEKPINLEFSNFSCITFDNAIFWVFLLPNNIDLLHRMRNTIAKNILLPIKKSFDPHLTLMNTKNKSYEKEVDKLRHFYFPITDTFILALGKCDEIGQFTEVVYRYEASNKITCKP